ncbi:helix-turn-helix domain-containing protein [Streptomyces sp. SGAir0957]
MEHQEGVSPVEAIATRVRAARQRKGLTAQQLAGKVGWDRATVTKLETGRRQNVTVDEWLALARALDVAPIHLLVPLENGGAYRVTSDESVPTERARYWIRGIVPLSGTDDRIFRTEVPVAELRAWDTEEGNADGEQEHQEAPER